MKRGELVRGIMSSMLFDDVFEVNEVDPDGKKFTAGNALTQQKRARLMWVLVWQHQEMQFFTCVCSKLRLVL